MFIMTGYPKESTARSTGYDIMLMGKKFLSLFTITIDYENEYIEFTVNDQYSNFVNIDK